MGSKSKAPPAPDYSALMQQQQALDEKNYAQQLKDSRTSQVTAQGSSSWSQDANGNWVQTQTLSPEQQKLYNQQVANTSQQQQIANTANSALQAAQANGAWQPPGITAQYSQDYANNYADQMEQTLTARLQPQYQQDQNAMQTKLSLQGLQPGTEAYDRAYKNLLTSQGDVMSQANLQAQLAGQSEARNQYNTELTGQEAANTLSMQQYLMPWQTASTAAGLSGNISMPSFASGSTSTPGLANTDIVGAAQQSYAQQVQAANEANSSKSAKGSSIGAIVGGAAGTFIMPGAGTVAGASLGSAAGGAIASDLRLKDHIEALDDEESFNKLLEIVPISWEWKGTGIPSAGVAAQQIAEHMPELIGSLDGYMTVNYTGLFALLQGAFRHLAKELNHA
jgi:hypothetical protein